jgi:hypothetical protein
MSRVGHADALVSKVSAALGLGTAVRLDGFVRLFGMMMAT